MLGESTNSSVMEVSGSGPLVVGSRFSLHWPNSAACLRRPQFGEQRQQAGVDLVDRQCQSALILPDQKSGTTAWRFGHVGAARGQEQVDAGAESVPAILQRLHARVAARDLKSDGAGGEGLLDLANPGANHGIYITSARGRSHATVAAARRGPPEIDDGAVRDGRGEAGRARLLGLNRAYRNGGKRA